MVRRFLHWPLGKQLDYPPRISCPTQRVAERSAAQLLNTRFLLTLCALATLAAHRRRVRPRATPSGFWPELVRRTAPEPQEEKDTMGSDLPIRPTRKTLSFALAVCSVVIASPSLADADAANPSLRVRYGGSRGSALESDGGGASGESARFITLGTGTSCCISGANAVSANGRVVVGETTVLRNGYFTGTGAFRWEDDGSCTLDSAGPGGCMFILHGSQLGSKARGVSSDGLVVAGRSQHPAAFRWEDDGACALGTTGEGSCSLDLYFGSTTSAFGISGDGSVVVGVVQFSRSSSAFRWEDDGLCNLDPEAENPCQVLLGDLPGEEDSSRAWAISEDGRVIVGSAFDGSGQVPMRFENDGSCDLDPSGVSPCMVVLGNLSTALPSGAAALATSSNGSVVVGVSRRSPAISREAFRWEDNGKCSLDPAEPIPCLVGLGDLPAGTSQSEALAVSSSGDLVLGWANTVPSTEVVAFVWDEGSGMQVLQDLLVERHGIDFGAWRLQRATGIASDGRTIVGNAHNPLTRRTEAFVVSLLTPLPEPSVVLGQIVSLMLVLCLAPAGRERTAHS